MQTFKVTIGPLMLFFGGVVLLTCVVSCRRADQPADGAAEPAALKSVYVVNYPLKYLAERIAGDGTEIVLPVPAGKDPAYWMPDRETIAAYQQADLILLNGARYAGWVRKVSLPQSRLVDTSAAFQDRFITLKGEVIHSHGPEGKHSHSGTNSNTWLDPTLAILQAEAIAEAFSAAVPRRAASFQENFQTLKADLEALDATLTEIAGGSDPPPLVASHPVYDYLARHCGWRLESVHWEPNEMPDDDQWGKLETMLKDHPARWILWEAPPAEEIVRRLTELGIECVVFDPCGNVPEAGDYLEVMRDNVQRLRPVFATR